MVVLLLGPALLEELGCNVELNVEFGPSDAGGFGTTSNAEGVEPTPLLSRDSFDVGTRNFCEVYFHS